MVEINAFFQRYVSKDSIFKNRASLQQEYVPRNLPFREGQIQEVASILAPALKNEKPSNLFVYGKTGTGKTLTVLHTTSEMQKVASSQKLPLRVVFVNCKLKRVADTEYRLIAELARHFGKEIPTTGLPTDEVYRQFYEIIDKTKQIIIVILDEIDQLIGKTGDALLYNLTRINAELKQAKLSMVGISNDMTFIEGLDPRVKSSLGGEELLFPPYDAEQLEKILTERSELAFIQNSLEEGFIQKCAGIAARDHGDARRAIELMRVAGEIAERKLSIKVSISHLDEAERMIDRHRIIDIASTQPMQYQLVLYATMTLCERKKGVFTGEIYGLYARLCQQLSVRPLTQRRVADILTEDDMLGLISAPIVSKGRYGRTREITVSMQENDFLSISLLLREGLGL